MPDRNVVGLPELADPNDPWSRQDKCGLCLEPGEIYDGVFVHQFTGRERCTYKSHL